MKIEKRKTHRVSNPHDIEFIGKQYLDKPAIQLFVYDSETYEEDRNFKVPNSGFVGSQEKTSWLNIHGVHDVSLIKKIGSSIKMPRFIVQDIIDTNQRTKLQELDNYLFFSVKSILPVSDLDFDIEHISFILGHQVLYSFQEKKGDHFEHVRVRIREHNGLVREKGPDFLLFLLVEGILENYFTTVEQLEETVKDTANPLKASAADPSIINRIEAYKRKLQMIRKNIFAMKEALQSIEKTSTAIIKPEQQKYFYDLKNSCLYLVEEVESMELRLDSAENLYFSMQGHRMNQVMTTLTIMAAIFIPLTFVAGIYGMNFENMPELGWEWGYFMVLGVMLLIGIILLIIFKRRKWF